MKSRPSALAALAAAVAAIHAGTYAQEPRTNLRVVASFYPVHIAVLNVVGQAPGVSVASMATPTAGCLHDYQLTTDDMVSLATADVFVINGAGMESFLGKAMRHAPRMRVVDSGRGIERLGDNPHLWVSITRHMRQVEAIASGLAEVDPARAEVYRSNAAAYTNRLTDLRERMRAGLRDLRTRDIVTFHEAFPYFADEFGLNIAATIQREPGSEPTGRELARTIAVVRKSGIQALFAEPQYSKATAVTIARETGATVYTLDPLVTGPLDPDAYIDGMLRNLAELQRALK